jgi:glycosyltransferase involved in cell wall biosynthesis
MRVILITDAWQPQVNGVVRVLTSLRNELLRQGHEVEVVEPSLFSAFPLPWYPEIKMTYHISRSALRRFITPPCVVHIATEFAIGLWFRHACEKYDIPFTTSYHTDFPAYCKKYVGIPRRLSYTYLRWFHRPSQAVLVSTPTMKHTLMRRRFKNVRLWAKGVDPEFFHPRPSVLPAGKPVCMYVGRVAKEKNIEAFLRAETDARKVVVGDGPILKKLQKKYGDVRFMGKLEGEALAEMYASADCFVFPSKTDTLGMVLLEALASGVPVAAYPVQGPIDLIDGRPELGCLNDDLGVAIAAALQRGDREACRNFALEHSWKRCADEFMAAQLPYVVR